MVSMRCHDRAVGRSVIVLLLLSGLLVGTGIALDQWLVLSIGVCGLISGIAVELFYRP
ncbi:hypothetical protein [Streptomyces sp. PTY087I2]|uniref:hypothetical protein n=1 Tax=Streptomyces sp. PTY087I2 TaxID=1819298 RepID=UPI000827D0A0|nr:hypothetical protein [Streptomyces sp. PTY087I2]OCC11472.1 hypothetical protein A3Q37_02669 [Streptomyces sp. PTY087I2]